jgi:hypothetical protein
LEKKKKRIKHPVKENGYKFIFLAYVEGGALGSIIYFGSADRQAGRQAAGRQKVRPLLRKQNKFRALENSTGSSNIAHLRTSIPKIFLKKIK